jgi:dipeptidyl aminopeptidase/acylaminoacyl peptidase
MLEWPESADVCRQRGLSTITTCSFDYSWRGRSVEAIVVRPPGEGPFPGLLLIPGHRGTARDLLRKAHLFARHGFASMAITLPGYGKTAVQPDFVGPTTIDVLSLGYTTFKREPYVDSTRMGVYGYSRGGMAASLLVLRLPEMKAAVFGGGVYDFRKAYAETRVPGIRANMELETGMTEAAVRDRSSILQMDKLGCPVLILHGELDENVPVGQALALRDRLSALGKSFEIQLFPGQGHAIRPEDINRHTLDFFERKLLGGTPPAK